MRDLTEYTIFGCSAMGTEKTRNFLCLFISLMKAINFFRELDVDLWLHISVAAPSGGGLETLIF